MSTKVRQRLHDAILSVFPKRTLRQLSTCAQVAQELSYPKRWTLRNELDVRFHLLICNACVALSRQLEMIQTGYASLFDAGRLDEEAADAFEARIVGSFARESPHSDKPLV